jgi:hypothetical protein
MILRSCITPSKLLAAAFVAVLVAGCANAKATPPPTRATTGSTQAVSVATPSPAGSGVATSGSPNPSASDPSGLPHANSKLEALLPSVIGNVALSKYSVLLSAQIAGDPGGSSALFAPWLVKFGKTTSDVDIAIATDLRPTGGINFAVYAVEVPGATAAALSQAYANVASASGWPVKSVSIVRDKATLEIIDPAAQAAGNALFAGYVYAYNDVLYTITTDDADLLLEALIKLPPAS